MGFPRRIRLLVSYDGSDFCGWAHQSERRTVQGTLTEAVRRVSGEEIEIQGASRTDSGAHALGQVAHFDPETALPAERWARVLSRLLPPDVAVLRSSEAPPGFHARFSAVNRHYRYRIAEGVRQPHKDRFRHAYGRTLNLAAMQTAAERLRGRHDFRAFTEELDVRVENTHRELFRCEVTRVRDEVWVDVVGTAFLRGMMRRISGALLEVGRGRRPVEEVGYLLDPEKRNLLTWPVVLPARGLCLLRVRYGRHPIDHRTRSREGGDQEESNEPNLYE
jgi:tRNA pseudouridine38-40 synthase